MHMAKKYHTGLNQAFVFGMLALGLALTVISAFYASSFLAILGVGIVFWGVILRAPREKGYFPGL